MEIFYKKINNADLFRNFEDPELLNMSECQNYVPLYNTFFTLNQNNSDSINLNSETNLHSLTKKKTENIFHTKKIKILLELQDMLRLTPI